MFIFPVCMRRPLNSVRLHINNQAATRSVPQTSSSPCVALHTLQTFKFDDLCQNFADHEALDASEALVTATVDIATGDITGMTMVTSGQPGLIPITVPSVPTKTVRERLR